jgi:16S rRNA (uracil1498-N3)-methyltransferase
MTPPYVYLPQYPAGASLVALDEDSSKHLLRVLRMKEGQQLHLTDGHGTLSRAEIAGQERKQCIVKIIRVEHLPREPRKITLGVSLLKNAHRFEWLLEKATELGVTEIMPLLCERTEKPQFRRDRLQGLLASAMIQSQQTWMPQLSEPVRMDQALASINHQQKFIAHCGEEKKRNLSDLINSNLASHVVLVGPEGDFTSQEIALATAQQFIPVALGQTRLRSETAALVAAVLLKLL